MGFALIFDNKNFQARLGESVLDCLLRHEVALDYSCKSGVCQSCMLKSLRGKINPPAQKGLRPTAVEQGFFLACQQKAELLEEAVFIDKDLLFSHARLVDKHFLSQDICQLVLEPVSSLYYHAGQFINLKNPQGVVRSYSIV